MVVQIAANGILTGCIYSLIAAGLTLTWGVTGIINFSHGEFIMVSMYTSFWMFTLLYAEPLVSLPAVAVLMFFFGVLIYKLIIKRVINSSAVTASIATFGLSLVLENSIRLLFSSNYRYIKDALFAGETMTAGTAVLGTEQVIAAAGSIAAALVVLIYIKHADFGKAIAAVAIDKEAAVMVGINENKVYAVVFGISGVCVGIAGGLMSSFFPIHPESGAVYSVIAFVVAALGGIGNIPGAIIGGIGVGVLEALGGYYFGAQFKYAIIFILYLFIIQIKPRGLLG